MPQTARNAHKTKVNLQNISDWVAIACVPIKTHGTAMVGSVAETE